MLGCASNHEARPDHEVGEVELSSYEVGRSDSCYLDPLQDIGWVWLMYSMSITQYISRKLLRCKRVVVVGK